MLSQYRITLAHAGTVSHTIADFRKQYSEASKNPFKLYVHFLYELGLLGKQTIAVDAVISEP